MMHQIVTCRRCPARIFFAVTEKGHRMPLDVTPSEKGTVWIDGEMARTVSLLDPAPAGAPLYLSHFASCPAAQEFRKRGPERRPGR